VCAVVSPADCLLCGRQLERAGGGSICPLCWESLQPWLGPHCECCGLPLASERAAELGDALCAPCRLGEQDFDRARSYGLYTGNLRKAILHLKFYGRGHLANRLGELLLRPLEALTERDSALVVPVPLHASRSRQRGFNQAALLARGLVRKIRRKERVLQLAADLLFRLRPTLPQVGLSASARRENVRGVFAVSKPERVRDRTVLLVDDVMTTGATLSACAAALKRAGATRVLALSLARATPQFPDAVASS